MIEFKRILCPIDLSHLSIRALAYARAVATWYDADVRALHVVPTFEPVEVRAAALFEPVQFVYPVPRDKVIDQLREALIAAGVGGEDVAVTAEAGEAAAVIVDQSVAMRADLVVMGTHGRSGFDRLVLGSVTEKVLRKAPCPVLTVPPHAPAPPPAEVTVRTVLCPIDFSPAALQAFGFALDIARRAEASVIVLHALEWLAEEEPREFAHFNVAEYRQHLARAAQERLEALISQEPRPIPRVTSRVIAGSPHRQILRIAADHAADLIVMGAQGRGGPALALLGSTTQQVVREATCPVLTVRKPVAFA